MYRFGCFGLLVVLPVLCNAALAQPARPPTPEPPGQPEQQQQRRQQQQDTPEMKEIREAARRFVRALGEPEPAAAKEIFAGAPEEEAVVEKMHAAVHARKRLRDAAVKVFPDLAKQRDSDDMTVDGMIARLDRQPITVTGDEAVFGHDGLRMKEVGGQWRPVDMVAAPRAKPMVSAMLAAFTRAANETVPEVERGEFRTPQEMQRVFQARIKQNMEPARPATGPATRPVR